MGRRPCCNKEGLNRGGWTAEEDKILFEYIKANGEGKWNTLPTTAGLKRCGKSCRLRWLNYLRPDIRRGNITKDEEDLIIRLHNLLGNRWSLIAGRLPRRTDNEIKNYWNTNLSKKVEASKQSSHRDATEKSMPPFPAIKDGPIKLSPVKTTAFRCTKNFIQYHLNVQKIGTDAADTVPSDSSDGSLAFMSGNENASGHLMDFCGGREMGIPDILCTDFPKNGSFDLCDFDKAEGGSVSFRSLSSLLGFR